MQIPRPTSYDQYSYGNFDPAVQEDVFTPAKYDDEESDGPRILCGLTTTPSGLLVSFLFAVEGCFWLANLFAAPSGASSNLPGLHADNPYRNLQEELLQALGLADTAACVLILVGVYLTRNAIPKQVRRFLDVTQVRIASGSLGLALAFRTILLVSISPWFGFMMAYDNQMYNVLRYIFVVMYMAFIGATLWVLLSITMSSLDIAQKVEERLKREEAEERMNLLGQAYACGYPCPTEPPPLLMEDPPTLFGCLPLERTVTLYMVLVLVACIIWFVRLVLKGGSSGGGWALLTNLPSTGETKMLEIFLYGLTVLATLLTLSVIVIQRRELELTGNAWRMRKRITVTLLIYYIVSILRFAFFIPITGMAIAAKDVCRLYSHALQDLSITSYFVTPIHCVGDDLVALLLVLGTALLDGYMIFGGVLALWRTTRAQYTVDMAVETTAKQIAKSPAMGSWGTPGLNYGCGGPPSSCL